MSEDNQPPKVIYLIPEGLDNWVWCEDPAPGADMQEDESIKYIRVSLDNY